MQKPCHIGIKSSFVAVQAVFGSPIQSRTAYAVKETHRVPRKWTKMGRAPSDTMLHLQIGVKQGQFDELERHLNEGVCGTLSSN
jgi:tripeptidyl-peptidase-1